MQQPNELTYHLNFPESSRSSVILTNTSDKTVEFKLKINGKFFYSEKELIDYINVFEQDADGKPLFWKAWDFVIRHTYHHIPVSQDRWYHSPFLFINSFGFGLCDDINTFLAIVWKMCGYQSRVVHLGGHIVPEVFDGKKWMMMDADYGTYYLNSKKQIASIDEINNSISSLELQINDNCIYGYMLSHIGMPSVIHHLYLNDLRRVEIWYNVYPDFIPNKFRLPAGCKLEFTGAYKEKIIIPKVAKMSNIALAKLFVPQKFSGTIIQPLQIAGISGKGTIQINNKKIKIFGENNKLLQFENIINSLTILNLDSDIIIYYFVNPSVLRTEGKTEILISGSDCHCINLKIEQLQKNVIFPRDELYNIIKSLATFSNANEDNLNSVSKEKMIRLILKIFKIYLNEYALKVCRKKSIRNKLENILQLLTEKQIKDFVNLIKNKHFTDLIINRLF